MRKLWQISFLTFIYINVVTADSPAPQRPLVTASDHSNYYFTMLPDEFESKSYGVAYKLLEDGSSKEIWRVKGWYSFSVFLSNNGEYLVRTGNWSVGSEPSKEDLAVAFYKNGVELKSYSTKDLIIDGTKVHRTVSHYIWEEFKDGYPKLTYDNVYHLKTIEGTVYKFDVKTGSLVSGKSP